MQRVEQGWAGIDAGKEHHHVVVVDGEGRRVLSRRVPNDEAELCTVIDAVMGRAERVTWAIDLADGPAALMIAVLLEREQRLVFLTGVAVNRAAGAYRGQGNTAPRMRRSLPTRRGCGGTCASFASRTT